MGTPNDVLIGKIISTITRHYGVKSWVDEPTGEQLSGTLQCLMSILTAVIEVIVDKDYKMASALLDEVSMAMRMVIQDRLENKPKPKKEEMN